MRKLAPAIVATAAAAALHAPAGAVAADVTIGSKLAGPANSNICAPDIACTYVQTSGGAPVAVSPIDGTVVRWRLKAGSVGGTVKLRILRPSGTSFTAIASSVTQTVTSDMNTFTTNLSIKLGDVVALDNSSSGLYFTDSPAVALPLVKYFQPAIADGTNAAPNYQRVNLELLMNADVAATIPGTPTIPGVPSTPTPTPVLSKLTLKPSMFRAARSGASVARKRRGPIGTTVSYRLSTDATVAIGVERARKGRRRGGKCGKPSRRARGKRCTRYVRVRGSFNVGGTTGLNKFKFTGRMSNRGLARGRYRLVATPSAAGKRGRIVRASFRIRG